NPGVARIARPRDASAESRPGRSPRADQDEVSRGLSGGPARRRRRARGPTALAASPVDPRVVSRRSLRDGARRLHHPRGQPGRGRELAVRFADLRGFTRMAEHKLPYDVVFVLNRYFETVGTAITEAGGVANQFTGDGVMALFGIDVGPAAGCRQALAAARAMVEGLASLSAELAGDLPAPLRIGIGIHAGAAVVGRMGWGQ